MPEFIKNTEAYKSGNLEQALKDAFLGFDATLAKPEVVAVLKEIAGTSCGGKEKGDTEDSGALILFLELIITLGYLIMHVVEYGMIFLIDNLTSIINFMNYYLNEYDSGLSVRSEEEENVSNLRMEAAMPLEQVMAKYQSEIANPAIKALKKDKDGKPASPYLRARRGGRDKASSSSSLTAGCSSSSSWHDNEADVSSSSSQLCGSSSLPAPDVKTAPDSIGSSEAEQVLDSTTSNGESASSLPSTEITDTAKAVDMPDSSGDVKDLVSPSKAVQPLLPNANNETGINGAERKSELQGADSSKGGGDNVSSSCSTLENGEAEQQERISSSGRRRPVDYGLLCANDGSEEDDDDEEDETFDGLPER